LLSGLILAALLVFTLLHLSEAQRFALLIERARPRWVLVALILQVATYVCAGAIWGAVAAFAGYRLRLLHLARLSVEKLSVDHIMPSGGMSGNVVVASAMRRLGLPASVAAEALIIDILAYYAAYAFVAAMAFVALWAYHQVTAFVLSLMVAFTILLAAIPAGVWWLLRHRDWKPGPRLGRSRLVQSIVDALEGVSPDRIRRPRVLAIASALSLTIFLLDSATLWSLLRATGTEVHELTAFVALVVGSLAGTISFLPGGLGSFEAGCAATLALLGVPIEAALTGTLFLRGLTLWLPMIPGILLARGDLSRSSASVSDRREGPGDPA
jgi:uncharacterized protein (TIRG00374 family)